MVIQGCGCIVFQTFILPYIYHTKSAEEEKLEKIETAVTELQGKMVDTGKFLFLKSRVAFISRGVFASMQTQRFVNFASICS